jgi:hypothetical protein
MKHSVLIIPGKQDVERDAVAAAWEADGGRVLRIDKFWVRPDVEARDVALYGPDSFCLVLAQLLGIELVSPPDDLLMRAGGDLTKRTVKGVSLGEALRGPFPLFAKPLVPKAFRAAVWRGADDLREECKGLGDDAPVIVSEVVQIAAEARAWVLDREVLTCAVYEGEGDATEAAATLRRCAQDLPVPEACVLDAAFVPGRGWALLEANAAWGAGLNGCDSAMAVRCIDRVARAP